MADPNVTVVDGTGVSRRAVLVSNLDGEILFQENPNSTNAMVKLPDGSFHRVMLVANLADGSGSMSGTTAAEVSVNKTGLEIITSNTAQGAFQQLDSAVKELQDSVSVLTTSVELATKPGESTVVLLDELKAVEIDGRPSYKESGATVYGKNGVVGIISTIDNANQTANVKTVMYYAFDGAPTVVTITDGSVELMYNTIYNGETLATLTITNPSSPTLDFSCQVNFTSGATPTTVTASNIVWVGDNVSETVGFVPRANCRYTVMFMYDGSNIRGIIQGVSL